MTHKLVFPSLMHHDRAYVVTRAMDLWDQAYRAHMPLESWCGWYPTYGDGLVQHGNTCVVCEQDFTDYLASLGEHLAGHFEDIGHVASEWPRWGRPDLKLVEFAMTVVRTPEKRRWYSLSEEKISTSESKRHDRRWEEVPEWADGSFEAVVRLLKLTEDNYLLRSYANLIDLRNHWYTLRNTYWSLPHEYLGLQHWRNDASNRANREAYSAFQVIENFVNGWLSIDHARRSQGCLKHNMGLRREEVAA